MTRFRILTVCTGNICRSPIAEALLREHLRGISGATVGSAGTRALVGCPMAAEARAILEGMALVDKGHVGRQLTADLVRRADLVLTATREHRREVVELDPTAGQRSFTIREFGYVVLHANDEWLKSCGVQAHDCALRAAVATVAAHRGVIPPADPEEFDVADPFGGSLKDYAEAAIRMLPAIQATSEYLVGAGAMDRIKAATEERPKLLGDATAA